MMNKDINELFDSQLEDWSLAKQNYATLKKVTLKEIQVDGATLTLQFNPARIISSSAKVDKKTLAERPCFLCHKNLPEKQRGIDLSENFALLVNPFPILRKHFTIVNRKHIPQRLLPFIEDMLKISTQLSKEYTVFYNGPKCGASAPDHMHFQAGLSEQFPIWSILERVQAEVVYQKEFIKLEAFEGYVNAFILKGTAKKQLINLLINILNAFSDFQTDEDEPMLNVLAKYDGEWQIILFPREKHRPSQYFEEGDKQVLLSPASVDFGGLLAVPRKEDFKKINESLLSDIFEQLTLNTEDFKKLKEELRTL
ncbi:uncharacterized protein DUF4922 [Balneicella halophila]|uniref:GDP-D-glucose phosphorylase 1 n=1 Tax=Balneicella halophila TaxID=1537566 RepID=A0A7L4UNS1_BALHA|nr:DUF4922 domain-containing protein [Balneicella halophila]PVX50765.1 uncharacterized protein DUF4922 [Balneicella halophila]